MGKLIAENRRARYDYFLDEIFEGSVGEGGQIFGLFSRARFHI